MAQATIEPEQPSPFEDGLVWLDGRFVDPEALPPLVLKRLARRHRERGRVLMEQGAEVYEAGRALTALADRLNAIAAPRPQPHYADPATSKMLSVSPPAPK